MKKSYLIIIVVIIVIFILTLEIKSHSDREMAKNDNDFVSTQKSVTEADSHSNPPAAQSETSTKTPTPTARNMSLRDRKTAMSFRRPDQSFTKKEVQEAMSQEKAWSTMTSIPTHLPLDQEELGDGRVFIESHPLKFESLMTGDSVTIPIPHLRTSHDVKIERVDIEEEYLQWHGAGDNGTKLTVTSGGDYVTGSVLVNNRHYSFRLYDGKGWIHETGRLFKTKNRGSDEITIEGQHKQKG